MRELVTKYGDHMQTHLVDAIRGARLKDRGDPVTREGVGTEFKTVSLAKNPVLQPNNNALRCLATVDQIKHCALFVDTAAGQSRNAPTQFAVDNNSQDVKVPARSAHSQ